MGQMLDKVCCVENEELLYEEAKKNNSITESRFYSSKYNNTSSLAKSLPVSEIIFHYPKMEETVKSLSNLPISTLNVIRKQKGDPLNNYTIVKPLGHGAYGHVFKVLHKTTGIVRSMKIIPKNNLKPGFTEDEIEQEINILKNLDHPHVIKIYEVYNDDDYYYLINEFCSEGDLSEKLSQMRHLPECIVKVLMFQIFSAVSYLHARRIIHGDIKLENIMVDSTLSVNNRRRRKSFVTSVREDADTIQLSRMNSTSTEKEANVLPSPNSKMQFNKMKYFDLKLIDFGCSKIFSKYRKNFEDTIGTLVYCSPEVLRNNYNEKCDIWSCGVIMYILLSGDLPFCGKTEKEITQKILSGKLSFKNTIFDSVSTQAKDLITKCLIYDKNKRISVKDALQHPFFVDDLDPNNIFQENLDSKEILKSLKKYSKHSKFYQAVLAFLSHNFAEKEQLDRIKKIFLSIDLNFDGKISREELRHAYEEAGLPIEKEQLEKIIQSVDFDNNGFIEYEEFIRVTIPKEHLFTEANLKTAFDLFDLDGNGEISPNEVKEVLANGKTVDEGVISELLKEIQKTGDEEISFEQFKQIIRGFGEEGKNETTEENALTSENSIEKQSEV